MTLTTIHPFPARMAPEVAWKSLENLPVGARVLDPMCGSGTVLRAAVERGFDCMGVDLDPLSVLMSRVWTTPLDETAICRGASVAVDRARQLCASDIRDAKDDDTGRFISYWFAPTQASAIARLGTVLSREPGPLTNALAIALSRIIVSKEMMASLARDTSHSRPHRVATHNDFDVYAGFLRSARTVASRLRSGRIKGRSKIRHGDARVLECVRDESYDLVLTSPPYLNAIDYLRGHRLALVWLGYGLRELRETRASSVGAERMAADDGVSDDVGAYVVNADTSAITSRQVGWIRRYAKDMRAVLVQLRRVVRRPGRVVMVVGDSFVRGARVENARLVESLATAVGFQCCGRRSREIPARRRYLPPPGDGGGALDVRMRTETVLEFCG